MNPFFPGATQMTDGYEFQREQMVLRLRGHYQIRDEKVLAAMNSIPRHFFVPTALQAKAYGDHALPISGSQTISQPYIVARMTELLELKPGDKVLEIGAGSGYQTSILARLARTVYAIERVPELSAEAEMRLRQLGAANVSFRTGDGTLGWELYSPYDAILVAAGGPDVPQPLLLQLKIGGKLVIPIGKDASSQRLARYTRTEKDFAAEDFGACSFVPLIGEHGWGQ
jgi:protein-L-isoaspartate(D-aspartate) O-methyltransferase